MNTNPFSAIDQLLSTKGIESLHSKCSSFTDDQIEWFESDDGQATYGVYPTLSDQDKAKLTPLVQSALTQQLEELIEKSIEEIDTRTFKIDTDKERKDFCTFLAKRLELTIGRWKNLPISKDHPETFVLLDNFREHLKSLSSLWDSGDNQPEHQQQFHTVYELPKDFRLTELHIKAERLDIRQAALLFHYLREAKVFINYSDKSLAQVAHLLTGHSEKNLRTEEGLGLIDEIIKDGLKLRKFSHVDNYNLVVIRQLLEEVIEIVNTAIEANNNKKKK